MTLCNKHSRHLCWACILEDRPDLNPPGFYETVNQLYPQEETTHDPKQEQGHA